MSDDLADLLKSGESNRSRCLLRTIDGCFDNGVIVTREAGARARRARL